ncbi:MAG: hypothetical protein RJQ01_12300 [Microcella sp.]|uniref:hypothetical protein n=1 Tax=Microcella sp. TaxID=1913979 RepID=UPI003315BCC8
MPLPDSAPRSPRDAERPHVPSSPVEEGVLVARSALRLAIKNRIILLTLRDETPWSDLTMIELARREIETLREELTQTAERLEAASATPRRLFGLSRRAAANRRQDAEHQRTRARILRGVVDRLREIEDDPAQTHALLAVAREETLAELTQARLIPRGAEQSEEERRASIDAVKEDLREMLALQQLRDLPEGY